MSDLNPETQAARIREAIFAGRKIEAIKLHREQTGMGLKDSKEAIEKLEAELRMTSPTEFTASKSMGCSSLIALGAIVAIWRMLA